MHAIVCVCVYMFAVNSALVPEVKGAAAVLLATFYKGCAARVRTKTIADR